MRKTSHKPIKKEELSSRLDDLERRWLSEGLLLGRRPLESFQEIYGSVLDEEGRKELFDPITSWYLDKYGTDAMHWDGILARFPIILRTQPYLVQIPFFPKTAMVKMTDRVENLPSAIANTFTAEEFDLVGRQVGAVTMSWKSILELESDNTFLLPSDRSLFRRAVSDLHAASTGIVQNGDTQRVVFDAHAASEKFLKIAFRKCGTNRNIRGFGHRASQLFSELIKLDRRYTWLRESVQYLQKLAPDMSLRYETVGLSQQDAVSAVQAALFLCGCLSVMWTFDYLRGSYKSDFKTGKFYKNTSRSRFYCKKFEDDDVVLTYFESNRFTGSQMADIRMPKFSSPMYLEVMEPGEIISCEQQLLLQLQNPGTKVRPSDIGLKVTDSPTGIYTTAIVRRKIVKLVPDLGPLPISNEFLR